MKLLSSSALCLLLILAPGLVAQEQTDSPPIRISLVAVGDPPQPKFIVRGDKRELVENSAADYPPGKLLVKEKNSKGEKFKELTLGLNTPTGYVTYQGEPVMNLYRADQGAAPTTPYVSFPIPKLNVDMTILLTRDRRKDSWESGPIAKFLDNSLQSFPNDSVRYINLSAVPVRIVSGTEKIFELKPGEVKIINLPRSIQGVLSYKIAASVDGRIFPLSDSATTYTPDSRINLIAYNADGVDRAQLVKIARFFERPPEPPAKKQP